MTQDPNDSVAHAGVEMITMADAKALHGTSGVVFLDVREEEETRAGVVKGAVVIPRGVLEWQTDQLDGAETIIVYCAAGGRAALAGQTLVESGFKDVRNVGGFKDWVEVGGEVAVR